MPFPNPWLLQTNKRLLLNCHCLTSYQNKQWGVDDQIIGNNGETVDITFPISFPNEVFSCTQSNDSGMKASGNTAEGQYIVSKTKTHFTVCSEWYRYVQHENDWLAIGY